MCVFPLAAVIGGGALLAGSVFSGLSNASATKNSNAANLQIARETNAANASLAEKQQNWNIDLWNKQNDYNTPAAQMQRFKDAGLNPNLMYSQGQPGNAGAVSTVAPAKMERATVQPVNYFQGVAQGLSQGMSAFLQSQQLSVAEKRAEADLTRTGSNVDLNQAKMGLIEAQMMSERMRPELLASQIASTNVGVIRQSVETEIRRNFRDVSTDYYQNQVAAQAVSMRLTEQQIDKLANDIEMATKHLEIDGKRLEISAATAAASIAFMRQGGTLRELQAEFMRKGLDWYTADKVTSIIGNVVGTVAKGAMMVK